jgi:hypothetical protein
MTEFTQTLRHYCRNPRCRSKLPSPASDARKAFCTRGCHSSFYRRRCLICEQPMERKTESQLVCGKRRCRNALQASSNRKSHQAPLRVFGPIKNPIKSGIKSAGLDDRPWYIVAGPKIIAAVYHCATLPVDPDVAARVNAANDRGRIRKEIAWSKRRPPAPKEMQSDWRPCSPSVPVAEDLSILDFLKREPAAREPAAVSESTEGLAA